MAEFWDAINHAPSIITVVGAIGGFAVLFYRVHLLEKARSHFFDAIQGPPGEPKKGRPTREEVDTIVREGQQSMKDSIYAEEKHLQRLLDDIKGSLDGLTEKVDDLRERFAKHEGANNADGTP